MLRGKYSWEPQSNRRRTIFRLNKLRVGCVLMKGDASAWLTFCSGERPILSRKPSYGPARSHPRRLSHPLVAQAAYLPDHVWDCMGDRLDCADGCGGRGAAQGAGNSDEETLEGHHDCFPRKPPPAGVWGA